MFILILKNNDGGWFVFLGCLTGKVLKPESKLFFEIFFFKKLRWPCNFLLFEEAYYGVEGWWRWALVGELAPEIR